jgi:hypothetical protein
LHSLKIAVSPGQLVDQDELQEASIIFRGQKKKAVVPDTNSGS